MHPKRYSKYAQVALSYLWWIIHSLYTSCSQLSLTCAPRHCLNSVVASSKSTLRSSTINIHTDKKSNVTNEQSCPTIGIYNNVDTSSNMMVISPTRRWKMLVSRCHLSTKHKMRPLLTVL